MNDPIELGNEHRVVDNGVGDYDFICPTGGKLFFLPFMSARVLDAKGKKCPQCGLDLTPP